MKKVEHGGITDAAEDGGTVRRIGQKFRECRDRHRARLFDQGMKPVQKDILHARTEGVLPEFFENADGVCDDEPSLRCAGAIEEIQREGAMLVFGIEIDDVVRTAAWDVMVENIVDELPVRVNDRAPRP